MLTCFAPVVDNWLVEMLMLAVEMWMLAVEMWMPVVVEMWKLVDM